MPAPSNIIGENNNFAGQSWQLNTAAHLQLQAREAGRPGVQRARGDDYRVYDMSTDSSGNSYVVGAFYGAIQFGNTIVNNNSGSTFVAKISSTGQRIRATSVSGNINSENYAQAISTDSNGNSFVAGQFY